MLSNSHSFFEVYSHGIIERREVQSWSFTWKRRGGKTSSAYFTFLSITRSIVTDFKGQRSYQQLAPAKSPHQYNLETCFPKSHPKQGCWNLTNKADLPKRKSIWPCSLHQLFLLPTCQPPSLCCWWGSCRSSPSLPRPEPPMGAAGTAVRKMERQGRKEGKDILGQVK